LGLPSKAWIYIRGNPFEMEDLEPLQFIGRMDRKNVKIFEGDIVDQFVLDDLEVDENGNYITDPLEKWPEHVKNRDIVTLDRFGLWLEHESFGYEGEGLVIPSDCEVVGNIFENPELLGGKL
jgi:uncharacterized phage protein (TIGR01671 family)